MFVSYAFGALVLVFVLLRQVRVRPVPRAFQPRLPVFLGVIGLFETLAYAGGHHHVSSSAWLWLVGTLVVGALGLGALRGLTMRVWASNGWVVRQGNGLTMALWLVSLLVHFAGDTGGDHAGTAGLEGAGILLYLGLTLAMQSYVVHRRALPLWEQLGSDAGRPLQVQFSQGPGMFFATFRSTAGAPAGWTPPGAATDDPNVIDAEVVDDDDHGPPELHAPR
jgi:hypothetical membrane protein